jgi:hypothetical protein
MNKKILKKYKLVWDLQLPEWDKLPEWDLKVNWDLLEGWDDGIKRWDDIK